MLRKLFMLALVAMVGITISCKGPEGDVGPKGDKGDTGATGATGAQGPAGDGGGSALAITTTGDTTDTDGGFILGLTDLSAEEQEVVENSAVLVYLKSGGAYWSLPGIVGFAGSKFSEFTSVHYINEGDFIVEILQTNWSEDQNSAPSRIVEAIKVVIVPAAKLNRMSAEVDFKDYEATIKALNIADSDIKTYKRSTVLKKKSL